MKRVLAAVLGASLLLAGCGQSSTPAATSAPGPYADGLDHSWTASTAEGQRIYNTLSQGLKSQDFSIGLSVTATNGYGPIELNTSNGEYLAGDGHPITLNGKAYSTGLGVHANSEIHIQATGLVTPACTRFQADVGVDDEVRDNGSVIFQVFADGVKLFDSGVMTGASATQHIDVGIGNKSDLRFVVTDAGNNSFYDHADWAGATFSCAPVTANSLRPMVTGLFGNQEFVGPPNPNGTASFLPAIVTITGSNLQGATVQFGTEFGRDYYGTNVQINSDGTSLTTLAPPSHTGQVPIVVKTKYGSVNAGLFTYVVGFIRPDVHLLSLSPVSGPQAGGTVIKLNAVGDVNYTPSAAPRVDYPIPDVYFGDVKAVSYYDSNHVLTTVAPPGTGEVGITLKCPAVDLGNTCPSLQGRSEILPYLYLP